MIVMCCYAHVTHTHKLCTRTRTHTGAMDRQVAFGPDVEEGEIERALEAARVGQSEGVCVSVFLCVCLSMCLSVCLSVCL